MILSMFKNRYDNLIMNKRIVSERLKALVENKAGHYERAEYFCWKDHRKMKEIREEYFSCNICDVYYNTEKYNIKRTNKPN